MLNANMPTNFVTSHQRSTAWSTISTWKADCIVLRFWLYLLNINYALYVTLTFQRQMNLNYSKYIRTKCYTIGSSSVKTNNPSDGLCLTLSNVNTKWTIHTSYCSSNSTICPGNSQETRQTSMQIVWTTKDDQFV
jgi:hypothetical protein